MTVTTDPQISGICCEGTLVTESQVFVSPTGTTQDRTNAQAAATVAALAGLELVLGAGTWNFTAGGVVIGTGKDLLRNGVAGNAYQALRIRGLGKGVTRINVGAGQKAFFYANDASAIGCYGGVSDLSIIGPGIGSGAVGIQYGGRSAVRSDLLLQMYCENVEFDNLTSCMIVDDVSILSLKSLRLGRFKYGFEWGYNADDVECTDLFAAHDESVLNAATVTITNGSSNITVPSGVAARLQVGYNINARGAFPAGTYVGSIVGTTVTAVNFNGVAVNATANASSASFYCGRVFNFGNRVAPAAGSLYPSQGSTFVSPYWSTIYPAQSGRLSATNHFYQGLINEVELVSDIPGNSHANITHRLYTERISQMARISDAAATQQAYSLKWEKCYAGFAERLLAPWIQVFAADMNFGLEIKGCFSDSTPISERWLRCDGFYGLGRVVWEDNNLQSTGGQVQFGDANSTFAAQPSIPFGGAFYLGSARKGDAIQPWIDNSWHYYGQDGMEVPLASGSRTINNPATWNLQSKGKEFCVYLTAQGANTCTFGTMFRAVGGGSLGTVAAGATGQKMTLRFHWDGERFVLQVAPTWVTP